MATRINPQFWPPNLNVRLVHECDLLSETYGICVSWTNWGIQSDEFDDEKAWDEKKTWGGFQVFWVMILKGFRKIFYTSIPKTLHALTKPGVWLIQEYFISANFLDEN